jgi:hypothetical protein
MTVLTIHTDNLIAIETYCGDDVKYIESFETWQDLLATLSEHFDFYAWIEVK